MADPITHRQPCSLGRGFAVLDPERQREVVGYVRNAPIETLPAARNPAGRTAPRREWKCVPRDRDDEGSSSRHSG
jgi:delta 1-pyrroline-5-carboxylate dehydrogenase